jgi:putative NADH-flavin reductase
LCATATRLGAARDGLEVVVADVMDPSAIVEVVSGRDAVVSDMGSRAGRAPTTLCADSSRSIVEAMHRAGTRRLVVLSGTGPFDEGEGPVMSRPGPPAWTTVRAQTDRSRISLEERP